LDAARFDTLARILSRPGSRRRALGLLAALPAAGGLLALVRPDDAEGKTRRERRKDRHRKRKDKARGKRRRKQNRRACKPKKQEVVCAGRCGEVKNKQTCGKRVDCGPCECNPPCQSPTPTCVDGICTGCTSDAECGDNAICVEGACHACDVTCSGNAEACGEALQAALEDESLTTIYVCPGTYQGGFSISRALSVIGAGAEQTILDGNDEHQVMVISEIVPVTLQALAITRGLAPEVVLGAGLYVRGDLTLVDAVVSGNHATGANSAGGGIYSIGAVTLRNTIVRENSARYGGGVHLNVKTGERGSLTLESGSRVEWNEAKGIDLGYGGGIYAYDASATLESGSWVTNNTATESGGGLYYLLFHPDASITVEPGAMICGNGLPQCAGIGTVDGACPTSETCPA
jgi:hypothetical protein